MQVEKNYGKAAEAGKCLIYYKKVFGRLIQNVEVREQFEANQWKSWIFILCLEALGKHFRTK